MNLATVWFAVMTAGAALAYRWRGRIMRLCAVVVGTAIALAPTFLATGPSIPAIFEPAAKAFAGTVLVGVLSVAVVVGLLPRLQRRSDRWSATLLCILLAVAYAGIGTMLWRIADDGLQLATVPKVRTGAGILQWRDSAPRHRIYGVLVEGRLGEPPVTGQELAKPQLLATSPCRRIGPFSASPVTPWLPSSFTLTLADSSQAWAQGIGSVSQAWGWPPSEYRLRECGLRVGDPVVFWGHPGATRLIGSDQLLPAVNGTMVIAYGDLAAFSAGFIPAAERTGRATLALAVLNGLLAVAVGATGIREFARLRRDGADSRPDSDGSGPD